MPKKIGGEKVKEQIELIHEDMISLRMNNEKFISGSLFVLPEIKFIAELVYNPMEHKTKLAFRYGNRSGYAGGIKYFKKDILMVVYNRDHYLIKNRIVSFPSETIQYESKELLVQEIREFIAKYVDVSRNFLNIASYYVLFSWIFDCFNEVPYLRALGNPGTGKTRFLDVIGSLCYKSIYSMGAMTSAPLFRIIDEVGGTFLIDEADLQYSDTKADMVKMLNVGNSKKSSGVLRCVGDKHRVKSFKVFGPKILASRELFQDNALESRFITERMRLRKMKSGMPISLPADFDEKALKIRNKLLKFRLDNYFEEIKEPNLESLNVEPRIKQVIRPLLSIVDDPTVKKSIECFMKEKNDEIISERGTSFEADILQIVYQFLVRKIGPNMINIARLFNKRHAGGKKDMSARGVASILRNKLVIRIKRSNKGFVVPFSEEKRIRILAKRYGFALEKHGAVPS